PQIQSAQLDISPTRIEGQRTRFGGAVFPVRMVIATKPMPVLLPSVALLELALRATGPIDQNPVRIPILRSTTPGLAIDTIIIRKSASDSVVIEMTEGDLRLGVERDGAIRGGSGFGPAE